MVKETKLVSRGVAVVTSLAFIFVIIVQVVRGKDVSPELMGFFATLAIGLIIFFIMKSRSAKAEIIAQARFESYRDTIRAWQEEYRLKSTILPQSEVFNLQDLLYAHRCRVALQLIFGKELFALKQVAFDFVSSHPALLDLCRGADPELDVEIEKRFGPGTTK